jgi:hypothetical protein
VRVNNCSNNNITIKIIYLKIIMMRGDIDESDGNGKNMKRKVV